MSTGSEKPDSPAPEAGAPLPADPPEPPAVADNLAPEPAAEQPEPPAVADNPAPEPAAEQPEPPAVADNPAPEPAAEQPEPPAVADNPAPEPAAEQPEPPAVVDNPAPEPDQPAPAAGADTPAPAAAADTPAPAQSEQSPPPPRPHRPRPAPRRPRRPADEHRTVFFARLTEMRNEVAEGDDRRAAKFTVAIERVGADAVRDALRPQQRADGTPMKWSAVCCERARGSAAGSPEFLGWVRLAGTPVREIKGALGDSEPRRPSRQRDRRDRGPGRRDDVSRQDIDRYGSDGQLSSRIVIPGLS